MDLFIELSAGLLKGAILIAVTISSFWVGERVSKRFDDNPFVLFICFLVVMLILGVLLYKPWQALNELACPNTYLPEECMLDNRHR